MRVMLPVAFVVALVAPGNARTPRRVCRAACQPAVEACVESGARRRACRRHLVRRCRRHGIAVCHVDAPPPSVTTTTTSGPPTSTTTLPAGPTVNGCNAERAMDLRGETAVTVRFGVDFDLFDYGPECIIVSPGTAVTFSGSSFAFHPLVGGKIVGGRKRPDPASPFGRVASGSSRTFVMDAPGTYGYYCDAHGVDFRMRGAVIVAP